MRNPLTKDSEPREVKFDRNLRFERMFETRSLAWEQAGLRLEGDRRISVSELFSGQDSNLAASATVAFLSQVVMENEFLPARIDE